MEGWPPLTASARRSDVRTGRVKPISLSRIKHYAAVKPEWRNNASMLGARPRNALNDSAALRLPPTAKISFQNFAPVAFTSPLSSNAA